MIKLALDLTEQGEYNFLFALQTTLTSTYAILMLQFSGVFPPFLMVTLTQSLS